MARGHRAHQRPLAAVTLAAAAEHADQATGAVGTQRTQYLRQRIGGVCVIDDRQRLAGTAAETLHATRHRAEHGGAAQHFLEWQIQQQEHRDHRQQILGVETPEQTGPQFALAPARTDGYPHARGRRLDDLCAHVSRRAEGEAGAHQLRTEAGDEFASEGIATVDDREAQTRHGEKPLLGAPVAIEIAMVIQR